MRRAISSTGIGSLSATEGCCLGMRERIYVGYVRPGSIAPQNKTVKITTGFGLVSNRSFGRLACLDFGRPLLDAGHELWQP